MENMFRFLRLIQFLQHVLILIFLLTTNPTCHFSQRLFCFAHKLKMLIIDAYLRVLFLSFARFHTRNIIYSSPHWIYLNFNFIQNSLV